MPTARFNSRYAITLRHYTIGSEGNDLLMSIAFAGGKKSTKKIYTHILELNCASKTSLRAGAHAHNQYSSLFSPCIAEGPLAMDVSRITSWAAAVEPVATVTKNVNRGVSTSVILGREIRLILKRTEDLEYGGTSRGNEAKRDGET